jgi:hypothetical protein
MRPASLAALTALLALALAGMTQARTLDLGLPAPNASAAWPVHGRSFARPAHPPPRAADLAARRPTTTTSPSTVKESLPVANPRPLIGIMTQACHRCPGTSYIAAAYAKWIEAAGGRAVPIRFSVSDAELRRLFESINGIIFPGGLTDVHPNDPYTVAARKLYGWAKGALSF